MAEFNRHTAKTHSGIWRDLAVRKRKTEVDAQIAIIATLGTEAGIPTPAINKLVDLIHDIEDGDANNPGPPSTRCCTMKLDFANRRVAVTGAAQGIGRGIVQALPAEGAHVWALDLDEAGLRVAAERAPRRPAPSTWRIGAPGRVVREMSTRLGGIDILVNCAGGVRGQVGRPIEEVSEDDWLVSSRPTCMARSGARRP